MGFTVDPAVIHASAAAGDRWYPYAARFPIPEADTQAHITARLLILHSMAAPNMTSIESIGAYWRRDDIHDEATFALAMSGQMAQFVPVDVRADCNYRANGFATSVETQDQGSATLASTPWTPEQCEQLAGLAAWEHLHPLCNLPLVTPDRWDGAGVGPHRLFAEWSKYVGKTCPGDARVAQIAGVLERASQIVAWASAPIVIDPQPQPTPDPHPPASGLELIAMYQIAFDYAPGRLECRVTATQIIHETNGVAAAVDRAAGVPQVVIGWEEFMALLAGGRQTVGEPFGQPGNPWYVENLANAWAAARVR